MNALFSRTGPSLAAAAGLFSFAAVGSAEDAGTELTVSEYKGMDLVMEARAARVYVDYQHWGFFRIGLLPLLVVENVRIKVQSADWLAKAIASVRSWNPSSSGAHLVEFRNLEITMAGENEPRLRAATARLGQNGTVKLSDVSIRGAGGPVSVPKGVLQISGPAAGTLEWNSGGHPQQFSIVQTAPGQTTPEKTP